MDCDTLGSNQALGMCWGHTCRSSRQNPDLKDGDVKSVMGTLLKS